MHGIYVITCLILVLLYLSWILLLRWNNSHQLIFKDSRERATGFFPMLGRFWLQQVNCRLTRFITDVLHLTNFSNFYRYLQGTRSYMQLPKTIVFTWGRPNNRENIITCRYHYLTYMYCFRRSCSGTPSATPSYPAIDNPNFQWQCTPVLPHDLYGFSLDSAIPQKELSIFSATRLNFLVQNSSHVMIAGRKSHLSPKTLHAKIKIGVEVATHDQK